MTTLSDIRGRLRTDLHDTDSANYRWTDGELDRHTQRAVREFSLAVPLEAKATLTATPGSRDLSISGLADLVAIEAVEYPAGHYPPCYVRYSVWLSTLTMLIDGAPAAADPVAVYYTRLHTIDGSGIDAALPLRRRDRRWGGRLRRGGVGVLRDEPSERRRAGRLARLPRLGRSPPRRVPVAPSPPTPGATRSAPAASTHPPTKSSISRR